MKEKTFSFVFKTTPIRKLYLAITAGIIFKTISHSYLFTTVLLVEVALADIKEKSQILTREDKFVFHPIGG